jgi:ferredoxin-nitrite reductase
MLLAQDRALAAGKKLANEEQAKRAKPPLDMWDELVANAAGGRYPKGTDVFLYRYHGLFFVGPAQDSFMSRLKLPNGIVRAWQLQGLADLAERYGGGYAHVTTRANLQVREIEAADAVRYLEGLFDLGITSKGSGADNIRNITGSPTAGIDPQELIDTRPLARTMQHHILNSRALFGLPRKFNIAYDGGGRIAALEETNDIGFTACRVGEGAAVPPGVYFRLALGGISGHRDLALDEGVVVHPDDCTAVADAILRVFLDEGDRTDRKKARLKHVLDRLGHAGFLARVEERLGRALPRVPMELCAPRGPIDRMGHLGIHPQAQEGRYWLGVVLPVGRMTPGQMRLLADLALTYGDGDIRLTVWQNLLLSGLREADLDLVKARLEAGGLDWRPHAVRTGLVACTGATGCKFGLARTKETAEAIAAHLDGRLDLDQPVNIHLTGCPNSCAQHYIGDIGLLGTKIERGEDTLDGFRLVVGGGWGNDARIARELGAAVPSEAVPAAIERMLRAWLDGREPNESFAAFANRQDIATLNRAFGLDATGDAAP